MVLCVLLTVWDEAVLMVLCVLLTVWDEAVLTVLCLGRGSSHGPV